MLVNLKAAVSPGGRLMWSVHYPWERVKMVVVLKPPPPAKIKQITMFIFDAATPKSKLPQDEPYAYLEL
jgi:hypothetical protein